MEPSDEIEEIVEDSDSNRSSTPSSSFRSAVNSMIAGAGAGIICTLVCAPLDVLKVRLQVQGQLGMSKYHGNLISNTYQIFREEGIRGTFRGVGPALLTVPIFWGVYWPLYNRMKAYFYHDQSHIPSHVSHLLSAISAGAVGDLITNPFWVTRTRLQTHTMHTSHVNATVLSRPMGSIEMIRTIYREEGLAAFYKGLGASFLGLSHVAIQFPLYEYLKEKMQEKFEDSPGNIIIASIVSKLVASSISYPHEVLRSRLQDGRKPNCSGSPQGSTLAIEGNIAAHKGLFPLLRHIIKHEGIGTLWVGLQVNLIRVIPATLSTFLSYEYLSRYLNSVDTNRKRN